LDMHIAVAVPLDLIDLAGFGAPPPPFPGVIHAGTGFAEIFAPGANQNSAATSVIGTRNVAFGAPNTSGVNTPQGVAFESPFDGVNRPGANILAIANTLPTVVGPADLNLACSAFANAGCLTAGLSCPAGSSFSRPAALAGVGPCCPTGTIFVNGTCHNPNKLALPPRNFAPLGPATASCCTSGPLSAMPTAGTGTCQNNLCTGVATPFACCTGAGAGTCPGFTVGTITEFDTSLLNTGTPGFNDAVPPITNNPVGPVCVSATPLQTFPDGSIVTCPAGQAETTYNATIGGCDTFLAGPIGLTFDDSGQLFVANTGGFVTGYPAGASGDQIPLALIGVIPPTAGTMIAPVAVTVEPAPTPQFPIGDDLLFVSDAGDNSIKVYDALNFADPNNCFTTAFPVGCVGKLIATISGGATHLKRPEGIALGVGDDTLYVANDNNNTVSMFMGINETVLSGGGNVAPNLILSGKSTQLNFPVGVALPAFTPSSTETVSGVGAP
ncbi:MAG TPA: hypothetical protein VGR40_08855, partial [Candidatus Binatus sp.]|nr:hypothetical protein [Candidatus Binatus sp.]